MNILLLGLLKTANYVTPGIEGFDPHQSFKSVGVFGSFGKGSELQERDNYGLLTFDLKKDAPENTLVWINFFGQKDLVLGHSAFPGTQTSRKFSVQDWTTGILDSSSSNGSGTDTAQTVFSRCFPAALFESSATTWKWKPGDLALSHLAYRNTNGRVVTVSSNSSFSDLGSPWIIAWNTGDPDKGTVPMLIRLEKKPKQVLFGSELSANFSGPVHNIVVMPLFGIKRSDPSSTEWKTSPPSDAIEAADLWTRISARFPISTDETFRVDEKTERVSITDAYRYRELNDDWGTKPLQIAPVPPITAVASDNGYSVNWTSRPIHSKVETFLGPYCYTLGSFTTYSIPIPGARNNSLATVVPLNDPEREAHRQDLNHFVSENLPKTDDTSDGGLNLQIKEFSQSYPLLDPSVQAELKPRLEDAFKASYSPENLQTVTDPVFGQKYVMCSKIWCAGEPFDREWYAGRQLDDSAEFTSWVDASAGKSQWEAIQGLYSYYRIYNDWAWSGTLSSVFAYALCGDGMNFAMEGMLGAARMAKRQGDDELWNDATYRASKEAVCTFASFSLPDYMKKVDYLTWTDTGYDYATKKGRYEIKRMAPDQVETRFGIDIYTDTTGIKVLRPGMFWHATAALYWDNPDLQRLYSETNLFPKVYDWEYTTMPKLFPGWEDKAVTEQYENSPLGGNLAIAHLDARSNLFGASANSIAPLTTKLQSDIAPLYRVRLMDDLTVAGIPQLWSPTEKAILQQATWDSEHKVLTAKYLSSTSAPIGIEWNWRGQGGVADKPPAGPMPKKISIDGKPGRVESLKGGFYRTWAKIAPNSAFEVQISY